LRSYRRTVSRGVTVGKSVGAVLLFLLGYWAIAALARRIERSLVVRGFDAPRVRTSKRWVLALSAFLLAMVHTLFDEKLVDLGAAEDLVAGLDEAVVRTGADDHQEFHQRHAGADGAPGAGRRYRRGGQRHRYVTEVVCARRPCAARRVETIVPNSALIENKVTN
jgi:hypothetical protein